jgi:heat shock protein HspQ
MAFGFRGRWSRRGAPAPAQVFAEEESVARDHAASPAPNEAERPEAPRTSAIVSTRFGIGELVRHRLLPFRGVIFDVDPEFAQSEEWWQSIPEHMRPAKNQPYYHLLAENQETTYIAYVSQQNLEHDDSGVPIGHPAVGEVFSGFHDGRYELRREHAH